MDREAKKRERDREGTRGRERDSEKSVKHREGKRTKRWKCKSYEKGDFFQRKRCI